MQTMERGLPRATAAQEVSVWAQTWLPALHTELFYELEKVPLFHWGIRQSTKHFDAYYLFILMSVMQ